MKALSNRLSRARALTARQWALLLRASFWLLVADLGLRFIGLPRTKALLAPRRSATAESAAVPVDEITRLVDMAARRLPYPGTCLRRALVLQRFLERQGIEAEIRIGVRKDEAGRLAAHAWLEHEGRPLGEAGPVEERFARLLRSAEIDFYFGQKEGT